MIAVVAVLGVAGCSWTSNDTRSATAGLPDTKQQLTAYEWLLDRSDSSLTANDTTATTLTFAADHLVFGSAPCNLYRGTFAIDEDTVEIRDISQTKRSCPQDVMQAEQEYLTVLQKVRDVDATDRKRLVLTGPEGARLAFSSIDVNDKLEGDWHVANVASSNGVQTVVQGTNPVLTFHDDGTLNVQGGCNTFGTNWAVENGRLTIDRGAQTLKACDQPQGVMEQEAALTSALSSAVDVQIVGDTITLLDDDGSIVLVANRQSSA
jgi:heat shock protein HslJ